MILILGDKGSMGVRYRAILSHLGVPHDGLDVDAPPSIRRDLIETAGRYIIATPTETHESILEDLITRGKPILCEKPILTDTDKLRDVLKRSEAFRTPIRVMMQYERLYNPKSEGPSYYNYFRHGRDGLVWDCFQIIALSNGDVALGEDSPVWDCVLNGEQLSIDDMDNAYVEYVQSWLEHPGQSAETIWKWHKKVSDFSKEFLHG